MADALLELGGRKCRPGRFWRKSHMRSGKRVKGTCVFQGKRKKR